jgi:hypothetical protein
MSYYDYQYVSLAEAWGRVPKYSKYSFYQSDKNEYGQSFTSFDTKGPQLDREFNRGYQKKREYDQDTKHPSRRYVIHEGDTEPSPPVRDTIRETADQTGLPKIIKKCDEYKTKLNYSNSGYPNTYPTEYFQDIRRSFEKEKRIVRFYNKAIIILLLGFLLKWLLDRLVSKDV